MVNKFNNVLREATEEFGEEGFKSAEQLAYWQDRLKRALEDSMTPEAKMEEMLRKALTSIYMRDVERGAALRRHPGVARFTLDKVKPELRGELSKRIRASAALIKIDRERTIQETMGRFAGWATSVPPGEARRPSKEDRDKFRQGMGGLSFRERRVLIDQGHKLTSAINDVVAKGGGAIAARWVSHYAQQNYDYREEHKELALQSEKVPFLIRDSWAQQQGLIKLVGSKYTDQIDAPGQPVFCRCYFKYIYALSDLPREQLTKKGADRLLAARRQMEAA